MKELTHEIRYALRKLWRARAFSALSIVTLALAIGAGTAIFTVVHSVLLQPLSFEDPDRLVGVWHKAPGLGFDKLNQAPALHFTYQENTRTFEDIGMYDQGRVSITGIGQPEQLDTMWVTDRVFPLLRVQPHIGRNFTAEDDAHGTKETAMLSHGYWQRRFGGDPEVVGRTLRIAGRPIEIIGVTPPDLRFLDQDPDLFMTFQFDRSELFVGNFSYQGIARLRPDATLEQANDDIARMIPLAIEQYPMPDGLTVGMLEEAGFGPQVTELKEDVIGDIGNVLWVLLGTVGIVLLIACANVTNLFLVRAEAGQREIAVRTALGAGRGRIVGHFLSESVVLAVAGGTLGVGVAWVALGVLRSVAPSTLPRLGEITLDATVLGFAALVSVASGLLFGAFTLWQSGRPELTSSLKEGGRGIGMGSQRLRNLLAISQIALASVLLIASGLMLRSFSALRDVHPGFTDPEHALTLRIALHPGEFDNGDAIVRAHEALLERIAGIAGVTSVGATTSVTADGNDSSDPLLVEEFPLQADALPPIRRLKNVTPTYFEAMGNPLLHGRAFTPDDAYLRRPVTIITENFAREYWSDPSQALGKRLREAPRSPWREIVGVVGNVHDDGVSQDATAIAYFPIAMSGMWGEVEQIRSSLSYVIRTERNDPKSLLPEVRDIIWSAHPDVPIANVQTLQEILDRSLARTSFALVMLGLAAAAAVALGAIGTYGVISYTVAQRTREIGVRMALGAQRADVTRMVLNQALVVAAIGIAVGLVSAVGLTRLMAALLFGVGTTDVVTFATTAVCIAFVALAAGTVPAMRATAVDPVEALHWN